MHFGFGVLPFNLGHVRFPYFLAERVGHELKVMVLPPHP